VTAGGISTTNGAISAGGASGSITANTTITAGTGITASSGNIVATSGTITGGSGLVATTGGVTASAGNIVATTGSVQANQAVTAGTTISATQTVTAGTGLVATTGGVNFTGQLKSNAISTNSNSDINPSNGAVFIWTSGGSSTLQSSLFTAGSNGHIVYVVNLSGATELNIDGTGYDLLNGQAACFVYANSAWRLVNSNP
jgi:hypothetical protein